MTLVLHALAFWALLILPGVGISQFLGRVSSLGQSLPAGARAIAFGGLFFIALSQLAYATRMSLWLVTVCQCAPFLLWLASGHARETLVASTATWRARAPTVAARHSAIVVSAMYGAFVSGEQGWDSGFHVTCIRTIVDAGFATPFQGFFKGADSIDPAYAFNPPHLFVAIVAWITGSAPVDVWLDGPFVMLPLSVYAVGLIGRAAGGTHSSRWEMAAQWLWLVVHAIVGGSTQGSTHPLAVGTLTLPRGFACRLATPLVLAAWLGGLSSAGRDNQRWRFVLFGIAAASVMALHRSGWLLVLLTTTGASLVWPPAEGPRMRERMVFLAALVVGGVLWFLPALGPLLDSHALLMSTALDREDMPWREYLLGHGHWVALSAICVAGAYYLRNPRALLAPLVFTTAVLVNTVPPLRDLSFRLISSQYTRGLVDACIYAAIPSTIALLVAFSRPSRSVVLWCATLLAFYTASYRGLDSLLTTRLFGRVGMSSKQVDIFADAKRAVAPIASRLPPNSVVLANEQYTSFWLTPLLPVYGVSAVALGRGGYGAYSVRNGPARAAFSAEALALDTSPIWLWQRAGEFGVDYVALTPLDIGLSPVLSAFPELFTKTADAPPIIVFERRRSPDLGELLMRLRRTKESSPAWAQHLADVLAGQVLQVRAGDTEIERRLPIHSTLRKHDPSQRPGRPLALTMRHGVTPFRSSSGALVSAEEVRLPITSSDLRELTFAIDVEDTSESMVFFVDAGRHWQTITMLCRDDASGLHTVSSKATHPGEAPIILEGTPGCTTYRLHVATNFHYWPTLKDIRARTSGQ